MNEQVNDKPFGHEQAWVGTPDGHMSIYIPLGSIFGISNDAAVTIAKESILKIPELCQCQIDPDNGNLRIIVHVQCNDWQIYAHAVTRKVIRHCAQNPHLWDKRPVDECIAAGSIN